jgi:hypothetical protein
VNLEMDFILPLEVQQLGLTSFNPDHGLDIGPSNRPLPKSYLFEKVKAKVSTYGFELGRTSPIVNSISAHVGDDEIDVSDNLAYAGLLSVFHEELGMKVSEEDTSINTRYGNFAEDLVILPDSYYQTYHRARNTSDFRDIAYLDVCKIRLAIDIRPMRMHHSATNDGKASMIGKRQAWIPPGRLRARYDVFSLFQDIHLGLTRDKKFAYLPEYLGGYGKRIPFERRENMERFIQTFRQGSHKRIIRAIIRRLCNWQDDFKKGLNPPVDSLLSFVSRFSSGYHDWVKGHSVYAPVCWSGIPPEMVGYRVDLNTRHPVERDVARRLLAEGYLVPESQVQIVYEHNEFCRGLLGKTNTLELRESITAKRKEWLNNSSIFSMEAYGYIKEITIDNEGHTPLIPVEISRYQRVLDDHSLFNLKVLLRDEPIYDRKVIDDLYGSGPMKVRFQMSPKYYGATLFASQNFRENIIDTEELGQSQLIYNWLKEGKEGTPPRVVLNDDSTLIEEITSSDCNYHAIVTNDINLCKEANRKTSKPIFRVPVEWYYRSLYFGDGDEPWLQFLLRRTGHEWESHVDDGSVRSFEEHYFYNGSMLKKRIRHKFALRVEERRPVNLVVEESDNFDPNAPPDERPDELLFDKKRWLSSKPSAQRA